MYRMTQIKIWCFFLVALMIGFTNAATDCTGLTGEHYTNCTQVDPENYVVHQTPTGPIGGFCVDSIPAERKYCYFKGIPFALPPIGTLRFKNPVKAKRWTTTRWCLQHGEFCIQNVKPPKYEGSEDCLTLNVYVPKDRCNSTNRCAVILVVPPGFFYNANGNSDQLGPDRYMAEDVIIVTFNYRLAVFGFANTGDENIQGNGGLMDQLMVMFWIKENIRSFGGEPGLVTLSGDGASLCYHCAAEYTRGLFSTIILPSTSCLNGWAFQPNPRQAITDLAAVMNLTFTGMPDLVQKLRNSPVQDILTASSVLRFRIASPINHRKPYPFVSGIDSGMPSLIPANPRDFMTIMLESGKKQICHGVKVIAGITSFEGGSGKADIIGNPTLLQDIEQDHEILVPGVCGNLEKGSTKSVAIAKKIFDYYFSSGVTDLNFYKYKTFMATGKGNVDFARYNFKSGMPTYFYLYIFCSETNYGRRVFLPEYSCGPNVGQVGPARMDDIPLEFYQDDIGTYLKSFKSNVTVIYHNERTDADRRLTAQIIRFHVNFARTGNPNGCNPVDPLLGVEWKPVTDFGDIQTMYFDSTLKMDHHIYQKEIEFWETVCDV